MCRFGSFHQPSPSVASPDSQVQNSFEPVGAAEAREADVLNKVAQTMLGPYLEEDEDAPTMKEKFEPLLEQVWCLHFSIMKCQFLVQHKCKSQHTSFMLRSSCAAAA